MKIMLDDRRPLPEDSLEYNCLRTYEECALLFRNFHTISHISLDDDLGEGETGLSVLKYMVECSNYRRSTGTLALWLWTLFHYTHTF